MDVLTGAGSIRAVPPDAPIEMATQSLRVAPDRPPRPASSPRGIGLRRLLVIGAAVTLTGLAVWQMKLVLAANGLTPLAVIMLWRCSRSCLLWTSRCRVVKRGIAGFIALDRRRLPGTSVLWKSPAAAASCHGYGAVDVSATRRKHHAVWRHPACRRSAGKLASTMPVQAEAFDIFILSDTTDPDVWIDEEAAFLELRRRTGSERIFYRRRRKNIARKAGNIADWVTCSGGAISRIPDPRCRQRHAGGDLGRDWVAAMERHPDVGIAYAKPCHPLPAKSTHSPGHSNSPAVFMAPLDPLRTLHGGAWRRKANYWGHNAR